MERAGPSVTRPEWETKAEGPHLSALLHLLLERIRWEELMKSFPCTHIPREQFAPAPCVCKQGPATRRSRRKRGKLRTPRSLAPAQYSLQTRARMEWHSGVVTACRAFKSTWKVSSLSLFSMSEVGVASHKLG